ncbi:putative aflatoxin biosynthesis ketoreductase nor-1 [Astrocystis sublimbata]|nr:putative aflatoxin biosynthesis ketoreductase nor-1 [Astrocystis sublimbata]
MPPETTNVLITGANRGIGRALAEVYLSRPNHIVICGVRNPDTTSLRDYEPAAGTKLLVVEIEATSDSCPALAAEAMREAGISTLDILIANAGINPARIYVPVADMAMEDVRSVFNVNAFSFITLFKAMFPFLKAATDKGTSASPAGPKLLVISSNAASIQSPLPAPIATYGASKLVLNFWMRHIHLDNPWLTAWAMNPGFVQTDMGYVAAVEVFGMEKAPHTVAESVAGLVSKLDSATREETSGNFYNFDGVALDF